MGRFAQYRKRGRASDNNSIAPPIAGDWTAVLTEGFVVVTILAGDPPTSFFAGRWRPNVGGDWSLWSSPPSDVVDALAIATDLGLMDIQIRWSNGDASDVSEGSDIKTVLVT